MDLITLVDVSNMRIDTVCRRLSFKGLSTSFVICVILAEVSLSDNVNASLADSTDAYRSKIAHTGSYYYSLCCLVGAGANEGLVCPLSYNPTGL